jgi:alpha-ketoglutarate-dependent taurine dioxygenase
MTQRDLEGLREHGWVLCGNNASDPMTSLAARLGNIVSPAHKAACHLVRATTSAEAREHTYSQRFGLKAFPFHTDLANWTTPPRYVLLRHHAGEGGVPTLLLDASPILDTLGIERFRGGLWSARGSQGRFLCNVLSWRRRTALFRWDAYGMTPEDDCATAASAALVECINNMQERYRVAVHLGKQNAILVIDNWRTMHARPPIPESSTSRTLERLFIAEASRL